MTSMPECLEVLTKRSQGAKSSHTPEAQAEMATESHLKWLRTSREEAVDPSRPQQLHQMTLRVEASPEASFKFVAS